MFYFYKILQRSLFPINFRVNLVRSILKIMDQKVPPGKRVGATFCPHSCYQTKNIKKKKTFSFQNIKNLCKTSLQFLKKKKIIGKGQKNP